MSIITNIIRWYEHLNCYLTSTFKCVSPFQLILSSMTIQRKMVDSVTLCYFFTFFNISFRDKYNLISNVNKALGDKWFRYTLWSNVILCSLLILRTRVPWFILNVFGAHEWLKNRVVGYTPAPISSKGIFLPASKAPSICNMT